MSETSSQGGRLDDLPRGAGLAAMFLGGLVIVSWHARWRTVLQLIPGTAPMQYNTALCFILLGAGLFLLAARREKAAIWPGIALGLLSGLTALEYVTDRNLGIDLLWFKPYFEEGTTHIGRMSPLAAVCFVLMAAGLLLGGSSRVVARGLAGAGLLACIVGVIGAVVLLGYAFGMENAYGWGSYARMAVNTAVVFVICAAGLFRWAWQTAREEHLTFLRWVPAVGSLTLIAMVAIIAVVNTRELDRAIARRQNALQTILSAQTFIDNILDLQRGIRGYVTQGDTNALAAFHTCANLEPRQWADLALQTRENAGQQKRLQSLQGAVDDLLAFDQRMMAAYLAQGFAGVSRLDATGEGRIRLGDVRDRLGKFSQTEKALLAAHSDAEQADYRGDTRLLVFGCGAAALLMFAGNFLASREMRLRNRAEARLRAALTLQKAILGSANYAVVSMDKAGIVKTFNPAAEKMFGYPAEEVIDRSTPGLWTETAAAPGPGGEKGENWMTRARLSPGESETCFIRRNGERFPVLVSVTALSDGHGGVTGFLAIIGDISERKLRETEREKLILQLQDALAHVKTLSGLIPICGWCKKVRSDQGFWQTVEQYVHARTDATFTHGICPHCTEKVMAEERQRRAPAVKPAGSANQDAG